MVFQWIPKEQSFFDLFEQSAETLLTAAGLLVEAFERYELLPEYAKRLERLEHDGDQITHELMRRLNRTFITPLDREDIHRLGSALDDVLDLIEETTERFVLYNIPAPTPTAQQIAKVIRQQVQEIHKVVPKLRHMRHEHILEHCIEINRLENVGDRLLRDAIGALFNDGGVDPITLIKWRDLYTVMESATDKCEDVAVAIESVVLKNA